MSITHGDGHTLALTREQNPFAVAALGVSFLYGLVCTVFYESLAATSIKLYPWMGGRVFLAGLMLGALTALAGMRSNTLTGMRTEQAGLYLLAMLCTSYALWTPFSVGWRGLGLVLFMGVLIAAPAFVVARRLGRQLRQAEAALEARQEETGNA